MRPHREPGIRRDARGRIQAYVRAGGQLRFKRFPVDTSLETVRRWRLDTRVGLWRWCADSARWASSGRHVDHRDRRRVMISM